MGNSSLVRTGLLFQADHLEAHRILFGIRFLVNEPENIFGVRADRPTARSGHLFGQFDDALGRGDRVQPAVLHFVESERKGVEGFSVQLALLGGHTLTDPLESGSCLPWPAGSHIARDSQNNVDAKRLQLGAVDGRERIKSSLRCARGPVEGKRQAGGPGADLYYSPACLPQSRKESIYDGKGAEDIHLELPSDRGERQHLQRTRSQNSGVTDEKIEPAFSVGSDFAGPTLDSGFVRDVATAEGDGPAGRLPEVRDFLR